MRLSQVLLCLALAIAPLSNALAADDTEPAPTHSRPLRFKCRDVFTAMTLTATVLGLGKAVHQELSARHADYQLNAEADQARDPMKPSVMARVLVRSFHGTETPFFHQNLVFWADRYPSVRKALEKESIPLDDEKAFAGFTGRKAFIPQDLSRSSRQKLDRVFEVLQGELKAEVELGQRLFPPSNLPFPEFSLANDKDYLKSLLHLSETERQTAAQPSWEETKLKKIPYIAAWNRKWGTHNQFVAEAAGRHFWDFEEDLQKVIWQRLKEKPTEEATQLIQALHGPPVLNKAVSEAMAEWWLRAPSLDFLYSPTRPSTTHYNNKTLRYESYRLDVPTRALSSEVHRFSESLADYYIRNVRSEITIDELVSRFLADWESGKYPVKQ